MTDINNFIVYTASSNQCQLHLTIGMQGFFRSSRCQNSVTQYRHRMNKVWQCVYTMYSTAALARQTSTILFVFLEVCQTTWLVSDTVPALGNMAWSILKSHHQMTTDLLYLHIVPLNSRCVHSDFIIFSLYTVCNIKIIL